MWIYCRRIIINPPEMLEQRGPVLLACNHPNSFLDGMILTTLFRHPVHSLARGDAFKNPLMNRFLRSIQLLPVYRTSEGVENLEHNYTTFAACQETFKKGEIVLIFSEGRCENEWHLRPLKKGTARLATTAWKQGVALKVIPTALNYSSFRKFGKEVHIYFGEALNHDKVLNEPTEGKQLLAFNEQLQEQLAPLVYEINDSDERKRREIFDIRLKTSFYFLALPAMIGWLLHAPVFYPCKWIAKARFRNSVHYDSVITALPVLTYPIYLILLCFVAYCIEPWAAAMVFPLSPLTAWCCAEAKYQLDH